MFHDATATAGQIFRGHRLNETTENCKCRLASARLRKSEMIEIDIMYATLNAERTGRGLPPAERAPWSPADILEWRNLKPRERVLDLETYTRACDRVRGHQPSHIAA